LGFIRWARQVPKGEPEWGSLKGFDIATAKSDTSSNVTSTNRVKSGGRQMER